MPLSAIAISNQWFKAVVALRKKLISFGKLFIANPDLAERLATDAAFNTPDFATFYGKGDQNLEKGYTDYLFLTAS
ncbi:Putative 12-oxophytodienoate reductase 5 [Planktothrix tepida]|uniref:Uncharacterized protein n=1 Tax=Planktothrix tepida PCC 9214 TaxID=671072 RepID=A0A1J1LD05_9CYAN|nr:hypothetical protein [Planktothrix tepida]CAD5953675.1 Putative 12-oxophytodienoate reductase 5 [Planktothrix tepida]CUR30352.1 hypothetical protein PL921420015 [Planktothrix tepida PCC 9214]